jgi:hypothetical protein
MDQQHPPPMPAAGAALWCGEEDGEDSMSDRSCLASLPALQPFTAARDFWDEVPPAGGDGHGGGGRGEGDKAWGRRGRRSKADGGLGGGQETVVGQVQMSKEERQVALRAALRPVAPLLIQVLGRLMAFGRGEWSEEVEYEQEQDIGVGGCAGSGDGGRGGGGGWGVEREGEERHFMIKLREELADVAREVRACLRHHSRTLTCLCVCVCVCICVCV